MYQHIFLLLTYRSAARLSDVQLKTVTWNLDKVFSRHITAESKYTPPPHTHLLDFDHTHRDVLLHQVCEVAAS